ncbi:MAG TPA: lipoprotein insertase outer membrane protein LolB [Gammaproteobacteria bacterium]|nr:lipoprotein insertase outer membrane protein LolB [Gammaproteobacteria bacterium]
MKRAFATLLLAVLALAGCAGMGPKPAENQEAAAAAYRNRAQRLAGLDQWQLMGRVSVQGPEGSGQVRVHWVWGDQQGRLQVRNPFGQTVMEVRDGPEGLRVRDSEGKVYRGGAARAALRRQLGWHVPVGPMARWALGLATGGRIPRVLDDRGLPLEIQAGPWQVSYDGYQEVQGMWVPRDLKITRGGLELHLRVDHWQLEDADPQAKGPNA